MFGTDNKQIVLVSLFVAIVILNAWMIFRLSRIIRQRNDAVLKLKITNQEMALLRDRALHDHLTGLPNRALLEDRIQQAVAKASREHSHFLVLFLDLDRFKPVNDMYGHETGDRLLVEVGKRIREMLREEDTIARIGGDEFVVLAHISAPADASLVIRKISDVLRMPFYIDTYTIHIAASIGKSIFPEDGNSLDQLLWKADDAMYSIKKLGRSIASLHKRSAAGT